MKGFYLFYEEDLFTCTLGVSVKDTLVNLKVGLMSSLELMRLSPSELAKVLSSRTRVGSMSA